MVKQTTDILCGRIIENETRLTLRQLCDACAVRAEYIVELVDEGFIDPSGVEKSHWCFSGVSMQRVTKSQTIAAGSGNQSCRCGAGAGTDR